MLVVLLSASLLSGCDRRPVETNEAQAQQDGNFAPETTSVASSSLVEALNETQGVSESTPQETQETVADQPTVQDAANDEPSEAEPSLEPAPAVTEAPTDTVIQPFATATPQPNVTINSYSEISGTGLGFKFSYPSNWNNLPGRSTVCYVQPIENGTVYPARVAVTMKKLAHKCSSSEAQQELVEYIKTLMTQYDESTFKVDKTLDTDTKFMGNRAMSTTYLAYDGDQEIQGYVIMTYFERYLFCFHFLCAYEDYEAFNPAMIRMRDSVQADQEIES